MLTRIKAGVPVYGGYTLTRQEGEGVIFVKGALPDEVVDIRIEEKKKDYSIARVLEIIEPSQWRVKPLCEVYGLCGGCQLQHADYDYQLNIKAEVLKDILRRISRLEFEIIPIKSLRPFNYRYRAQFKIDRTGMGFYKEASRQLIPLQSCPLMIDRINSLFPVLQKLSDFRSLKEIHVSSNGDEAIVYLKGLNYSDDIVKVLSQGISGITFENKVYGSEYINLNLDGLSYTVSSRSFFQTNWELNEILLRRISDLIPDSDMRLLDLYAGAGNFSIPLSRKVKEITAVEENFFAFSDLKRNIALNEIKNCKALNSSIEKFKPSGHNDIIIIDPPRPGMTDKALKRVMEADPEWIFYVSCNPATLARDIKKLSDKYEVQGVEMFDFFPNTYHIETLAIMKKRG